MSARRDAEKQVDKVNAGKVREPQAAGLCAVACAILELAAQVERIADIAVAVHEAADD